MFEKYLAKSQGLARTFSPNPPSTWRQFMGMARSHVGMDTLFTHNEERLGTGLDSHPEAPINTRSSVLRSTGKAVLCVRTHLRTHFPHAALWEVKVRKSRGITKSMV